MDIIGHSLLPSVLDDEHLIFQTTCKFVAVHTNLHKAHEMCRVPMDTDMSNVSKWNEVQQVPSSSTKVKK